MTALVEAETGGDRMTRRKWVRSSLRHLSGLLRRQVVAISRGTVGRFLKRLGFSLRANEKRLTGPPHPDRNRHNQGHATVGTSADTAELAVDAIAGWWEEHGSKAFPGAGRILILADAGGSNGCRTRPWKLRLQEHLVDRLGLCVTVCRYSSGASKWNPLEHRLFGPISVNWAGKPLRCLGTMLGYIRGTVTSTGLSVTARLLERTYLTKIRVTQQEIESVRVIRHKGYPNWNYTIKRRRGSVSSQRTTD